MGVIQVRLPDAVQAVMDRQVAEGCVADATEFLAEAARRFAEDLELEDDLMAEAESGIDDIEAGRHRLVTTREDLAAMESEVMARVRDRLTADKGCFSLSRLKPCYGAAMVDSVAGARKRQIARLDGTRPPTARTLAQSKAYRDGADAEATLPALATCSRLSRS